MVQGLLRHLERGTEGATAPAAENLYRGWRRSRRNKEHASLFFGREKLTRQLWQSSYELNEEAGALRILSILGPSGSSKSSVAGRPCCRSCDGSPFRERARREKRPT